MGIKMGIDLNRPRCLLLWRIRRLDARLFAALALLALSASAKADTCTVSGGSLDYGSYTPVSNSAVTASTSLTVTCQWTLGLVSIAKVCISLGGAGESGGILPRALYAGSGRTLNMNLFSDPGLSIVWGGTNSDASVPIISRMIAPLNLGARYSKTIPVYGQIPAGQQTASLINSTNTLYMASYTGAAATYRWGFFLPGVEPSCNALPRGGNFTFSATANLIGQCLINAQTLDFGTTGSLDTPVYATTALLVSCTSGTSYTVALSGGTTSGNISRRQMAGMQSRINYDLYQDTSRNIRWGDGTAGAAYSGTGSGLPQSIPVYGSVFAQTTPPPGVYSDTITATVTY